MPLSGQQSPSGLSLGIFGRTDSGHLPGGQNLLRAAPFGALEVSVGSHQSPSPPTTLQQLLQQGYPAKICLSAFGQGGKGKMGTARSCHGGESRKRCKETPLFFTTTSQPSKLSPGMGFLLGSPVFYLLSLATDRGGEKKYRLEKAE